VGQDQPARRRLKASCGVDWGEEQVGVGREVVHMGRDLGGDASGRQRSLLARRHQRVGGQGRNKVTKRTLRPPQVPRRGVEDGDLLGEARSPTGRLVKASAVVLWCFKHRTGIYL